MRIAAAILALTGLLGAQNSTFELPSFRAVVRSNTYPFGGPTMRYQQWYSPAEMTAAMNGTPQRILGVEFKAGSPGGQPAGFPVDLEIRIAHGPSFGPIGFFDGNMVKDTALVVPRQVVMLNAGTPGSTAVSFTFTDPFIWDGSSAVVLDFRIYSNNQSFDFDSTETSTGRVQRLFTVNNPAAANANFGPQNGWGLMTTFTVRPGATVPLPESTDCPGAGGFTPQASSNVPIPPLLPSQTWDHTLTSASSQIPAILAIGFRTTDAPSLGGIPLPHELVEVGAFGCFLNVDPLLTVYTITIGGGPGAGTSSVSITLPAVPEITGRQLYSQWLILDQFAPNGVGAVTSGLWHVVGPLGG